MLALWIYKIRHSLAGLFHLNQSDLNQRLISWFKSRQKSHDLCFFYIFLMFWNMLLFILADNVIIIIYMPNVIWIHVLIIYIACVWYQLCRIIYIYIGRPGSLYIRFMISWSGLKKIKFFLNTGISSAMQLCLENLK